MTNDDNSAAVACTSAMQCSKGKEGVELEIFAQKSLNAKPYSVKHTSDPMAILCAKEDCSRNLLIRLVTYDFLQKILPLPSQEIKKVHQEHFEAKSIKVGSMVIPEEDRRSNPDTSRGLWVNLGVRAQARAVQTAKVKKKEMDKIKGIETTQKMQHKIGT